MSRIIAMLALGVSALTLAAGVAAPATSARPVAASCIQFSMCNRPRIDRPGSVNTNPRSGRKHIYATVHLGRTDEHIIVHRNASHVPVRAWISCAYSFGHGLTRRRNHVGRTVTGTGNPRGYSYVKCGKMRVGLETVGGQVSQWGLQLEWYPGTRHPWKTDVVYTFGATSVQPDFTCPTGQNLACTYEFDDWTGNHQEVTEQEVGVGSGHEWQQPPTGPGGTNPESITNHTDSNDLWVHSFRLGQSLCIVAGGRVSEGADGSYGYAEWVTSSYSDNCHEADPGGWHQF